MNIPDLNPSDSYQIIRVDDKYLNMAFYDFGSVFDPIRSSWHPEINYAWIFADPDEVTSLAMSMQEGHVFIESVQLINGKLFRV